MRYRSEPHPARADRALGWGPLLSLAAGLIWPLQAAVLAWVLADLVSGGTSLAPLAAAGLYLALGALRSGLEAAAQRALAGAAEARIAALREELLAVEAAAAEPSRIGDAGALAALAGEKLEALRPFRIRYRPALLRARVLPPAILALAAWHSWAVALVLLMAGPLIPLFMALVGWAARAASERQMQEIGQLSDLLVDRLAALSDLRLAGAGRQAVADFAAASESLRERSMAVLRIAFLSSTVLELFSALGVAMVAVWVGFALLGEIGWGSWGSPIGPMAGIFLLLMTPEFFQPLRDLAAAWHDKAAADAVMAELERWRAEARPGYPGRGAAAAPMAMPRTIRLRGLAGGRGTGLTAYPDLEIARGDSLAILGPSGAGKTTLLRLLAGLERPAAGVVLLDGRPLDDDTADAWRPCIGWMPQAPHFLGRSLRHNTGFGAPLDRRVVRAARLEGVLAALPRGELTLLGERGAGLSGGEARRVMLARALHGGPGLLLADEPTADLDAETAQAIAGALLRFVADGGTLVAATHDTRLAGRLGRTLKLGPEAAA